MNVEGVMTRTPHTCRASHVLNDVARAMWEQDIGALPVVDDRNRPIAMITDRDVCMAAFTQGKALSEIRVQSAMSKALHTCHQSDGLSAAERTMRVHQIRRLPVVDDAGVLVGVLSLADIALARVHSRLTRTAERLMGDVALTLAAICRRAPAAQPALLALEDSWNPFEIQNSPSFRDAGVNQPPTRVPPPTLAGTLSQFRT
jgi:CBS domain-containing protein